MPSPQPGKPTPAGSEDTGDGEAKGQGAQNAAPSSFTLEEVAAHNTPRDCWMAIHGKVYDVTAFVAFHPGGGAILQGCGKDATTLFETRPMGSGTPHSDKARRLLQDFYLGELKP